jgi:hypothetical protein
MTTPAWPKLRDEDQWLTGAMDECIRESKRTPEELRAKAQKLRAEAEQAEFKGIRDACLAMAARYEDAAVERLAA